jgi:hypothetical protein
MYRDAAFGRKENANGPDLTPYPLRQAFQAMVRAFRMYRMSF